MEPNPSSNQNCQEQSNSNRRTMRRNSAMNINNNNMEDTDNETPVFDHIDQLEVIINQSEIIDSHNEDHVEQQFAEENNEDYSQRRDNNIPEEHSPQNEILNSDDEEVMLMDAQQYVDYVNGEDNSSLEDISDDRNLDQILAENDREDLLDAMVERVIFAEEEISELDPVEELIIEVEAEKIMNKGAPNNWNSLRELGKRCESLTPSSYVNRLYSSSVSIHLKYETKFPGHQSGINSIHFDLHGDRMVSAADDRTIGVWHLNEQVPQIIWDSEHTNNIRQANFLPFAEQKIVSASRNGKILLDDIGKITDGQPETESLMCVKGKAASISVNVDRPHEVLSCFSDSTIYNIDIRKKKPSLLMSCKDECDNPLRLTHIVDNPRSNDYFCVAGGDQFIRIYDRRMNKVFCRYKPSAMSNNIGNEVTSLKCSRNGDCILASYNCNQVYLFSTTSDDMASEIHKYSGHRNEIGVQDVSFFGASDQYIISGSDCDHVFVWDRNTEALQNCLSTYSGRGASALDAHPTRPVLASGMFKTGEIVLWTWSPQEEKMPDEGIKSNVKRNLRLTSRKRGIHNPDNNISESLIERNTDFAGVQLVSRPPVYRRINARDEKLVQAQCPQM